MNRHDGIAMVTVASRNVGVRSNGHPSPGAVPQPLAEQEIAFNCTLHTKSSFRLWVGFYTPAPEECSTSRTGLGCNLESSTAVPPVEYDASSGVTQIVPLYPLHVQTLEGKAREAMELEKARKHL